MEFSDTPFKEPKLSKRDYFFSQPHQPFFVLGIINAVISMLLFIPLYKGIGSVDPLFFHAYSMIFAVFTNFFYGFLYTTFPRFSGTYPIDPRKYLIVFTFNVAATLALYGSILIEAAIYLSILFNAASFGMTLKIFYEIYKECTLPKKDQYWLIVALGAGAIANVIFLLAAIPCKCNNQIFLDTAVNFGVYLYLIFLGFVVAFRMVPFFSHIMNYKKNEYLHLQIFVLFLLHSFLGGTFAKLQFVPDLIAAALIGWEIKKISFKPTKEPLLWILHLAMYWLFAALFIGAFINFFENWFGFYSFQLPLHLLVLGFLTTILIGFGTRVTLGHSQNPLITDKVTVYIFFFTQIVLLFRILFSVSAHFGKITPFFDISATLWIVLFIWWSFKYFKILAFGEKIG